MQLSNITHIIIKQTNILYLNKLMIIVLLLLMNHLGGVIELMDTVLQKKVKEGCYKYQEIRGLPSSGTTRPTKIKL